MIKVNILKKIFAVLVLILVIYVGILPLLDFQNLNSEIISTSIIIICLGLGYVSILFKPQWNKAILLIEGIVIIATGSIFLGFPYNYIFIIIGAIIVLIAIAAYRKKLPTFILDFFYK